jgi:hypothetical protein
MKSTKSTTQSFPEELIYRELGKLDLDLSDVESFLEIIVDRKKRYSATFFKPNSGLDDIELPCYSLLSLLQA